MVPLIVLFPVAATLAQGSAPMITASMLLLLLRLLLLRLLLLSWLLFVVRAIFVFVRPSLSEDSSSEALCFLALGAAMEHDSYGWKLPKTFVFVLFVQ